MLTIQPQILNTYRPAFKADEKRELDFDLADMDEDTYQSTRSELLETKHELESLVNNKEYTLPKPINKALKVGGVVTTGLLGGMATGWGTGKSIEGLGKLAKKMPVKKFVQKTKTLPEKLGSYVKKLLSSPKVKGLTDKISKAYNEFGTKKVGKTIVKGLNFIGKGIKTGFNKISKGVKFIIDKIKSVKPETYKKATINTVGVSGGIASGVETLKKNSENGVE